MAKYQGKSSKNGMHIPEECPNKVVECGRKY